MKPGEVTTGNTGATSRAGHFFNKRNLGILFDVIWFLLSFILIGIMTRTFIGLKQAKTNNPGLNPDVSIFLTGILFLSPIGAILKRWKFHERLRNQGTTDEVEDNVQLFVFSRFFSFTWILCISIIVSVCWWEFSLSKYLSFATVFIGVLFGAPILSYANTYIIYHYFKPPRREPRWKFLMTKQSAFLGDICFFINMICFQLLWGVLVADPWKSSGFFDVVENIAGFALLSLLFYFPPRIFYLAEDIKRPLARATIVLANLPAFFYLVFGIRI